MTVNGQSTSSKDSASDQHSTFWFDDGSLVLEVEGVMFKVHRTLLTRNSPFLLSLNIEKHSNATNPLEVASLKIDPARRVSAVDFGVLLEHLYHDSADAPLLSPLSSDTPFPRIASVIRASSPGQLHFPQIHNIALRYFADLFPSGPVPFLHPRHLEEALSLATTFNVTSIQKGLLYSLVTSTNFDTEGPASHATPEQDLDSRASATDRAPSPEKSHAQGNPDPQTEAESAAQTAATDSPSSAHKYVLSPPDAQRCMHLMTNFIDHFSPILFTPPATPHMACTDVFADTWMTLVIQPAIDDEGVYKPLETLERIKHTDWAAAGLCSSCVLEKQAEWTEEQQTIWRLMDRWLGL
ncbi:hypothetical protein C8F04DRAFT_1186828 [Mycena alexandri]|uniref:BTB domain-containing protein n=1 Tax=Mycena alexandri TaxID=1745969 RepID=A0AAD6SNF5_9AGAR|nr:hypothetical protein C8F04DRAFT_1186828 [Mycena alexandri]